MIFGRIFTVHDYLSLHRRPGSGRSPRCPAGSDADRHQAPPASQIRGRKRACAALVALVSSAGVLLISYFVVGRRRQSWFDSPPRERKVRGRRTQRRAANAVLTTVVDTGGRPWTPRSPSRSSGLLRRTAVDSRGPGHSLESGRPVPGGHLLPWRANACRIQLSKYTIIVNTLYANNVLIRPMRSLSTVTYPNNFV